MLSDEVIEKLVERLIQRVEKANIYFLKQIGAKIIQIKNLSPSDAHKLIQILKYGEVYDKIIKQVSKYTNLNIKEIDKIFKEFSIKDHSFNKQFYQYRNKPYIPYEQNEALKRQTQALANIVKNEMYDYTRKNVLGYAIRDTNNNIVKFMPLKETYNKVLDEAFIQISQGKETFDSAMSRILKEIGGSGIRTIEYESGRHIRLDSAIRMHTQSRLRELHNENQELFGKEFDADGVEITVHSNPAPDHEKVQGRQFSTVIPSKNELSEWGKLQAGKEAKDYKGNTYTLDYDHKNGYRPISEMNCYHYVYSIVLGVSEPEYSDKELQQIINDNNIGFEFEGKHYSNYEGTQLQRMLERRIREQKDIQTLAKASGNEYLTGEAQNKITMLTRKYKELSNASGLPTKVQRLKVSTYRRSASATKTYQNEINKWKVGTFDVNKYTNEINPTTADIVFMPDRIEKNNFKHPDAKIYYDKIPEILNNPDQVYKEIGEHNNTIWLIKEIDGKKVEKIVKINSTSVYQEKQLGYKNGIIHLHRTREKYIKGKEDKGELKLLFDIKRKK